MARWWEQALHREHEVIWPRRLHQVAGGNAGTELERWQIVGGPAAGDRPHREPPRTTS